MVIYQEIKQCHMSHVRGWAFSIKFKGDSLKKLQYAAQKLSVFYINSKNPFLSQEQFILYL